MSTIVIMPGGFHPFHAGHASLYQSALKAFPGTDVYVAATDSQEERPFPFAIKEKLAKVAGVKKGHFVQVKSPFKAEEITRNYDPNGDVLIFVRSEKDRNESPKPGGTKKDGSPAYFQPYDSKNLQPFSKHAYIAYLPTVEFGPGITSASEIRSMWPKLNEKRKTAMVMSLYPATQSNPALAANVVKLLDAGMGVESVNEKMKMGATIEPVEEGAKGAIAGGIAGAYLTKNPRGTIAGAELGSTLQNKYNDVMAHVAKDLTGTGSPVAKLRVARDTEQMKKRERSDGLPVEPKFDYLDEK